MLRIFKGTGPGVILLMVLTLTALWISAFIDPKLPPPAIYETNPMPLYYLLHQLTGKTPLPGVIFSFSILLIMLFLIVNFNTGIFFINERTFLPATIYIIFSAIFPEYQVLNPVLPALLFLMFATVRIMESYRKQDIAYNFFDAGLLIGIGSLFYANLIWFGLLLFIGIALLRTGNIKEILISILGLITPYIITAGLFFVLNKNLMFFLSDLHENLFGDSPGYHFTKLNIASVLYSGLAITISILFLLSGMNSKKIKSRKTFSLLLYCFFIALIIYFALPSLSVEIVWIAGVPASYFLAHYFVFARKKLIPEIIFSVLFLLIVLTQAFYLF